MEFSVMVWVMKLMVCFLQWNDTAGAPAKSSSRLGKRIKVKVEFKVKYAVQVEMSSSSVV